MGPVLVHIGRQVEYKVKQVTIQVEEYLYDFYRRVGQSADGRSAEAVMADALFKLVGELSCNALYKSSHNKDSD